MKKAKNSSEIKNVKKPNGFKATYKERSIFSFSNALLNLNAIQSELENPNRLTGLNLVSFYRNFSHSIEMFCKSTLHLNSRYLVLHDLRKFDILMHDESGLNEENTCSALVALARVSKIFKGKITEEHLNRLRNLIHLRNCAEHGEFEITNYRNEIHLITIAIDIFEKMYNTIYSKKHLLKETQVFVGTEVVAIINQMKTECSDEFQQVKALYKREKKKFKFIDCEKCYYPYAKLNKTHDRYTCLWCKDYREKRNCSSNKCKNIKWASTGDVNTLCLFHQAYNDTYASLNTIYKNNTWKAFSDQLDAIRNGSYHWNYDNPISSWNTLSDMNSLSFNTEDENSDAKSSEVKKKK